MGKKVTTLEKVSFLSPERRSGNSTRLVDAAIQIIFDGDTCVVLDCFEMGAHEYANRCLLDKIMLRMKNEHGWVEFDVVEGFQPEISLKTNN